MASLAEKPVSAPIICTFGKKLIAGPDKAACDARQIRPGDVKARHGGQTLAGGIDGANRRRYAEIYRRAGPDRPERRKGFREMVDLIRDAAAAGKTLYGSWIAIGDPVSVEIMGKSGFDFAILDAQHGGITWNNMLPALQALNLGGSAGFVRVGWNDPVQIMRAVDLGAIGVIVPMVSTAAEAKLAAQAIRYPPAGIRSYGRVRSYYSGTEAPEPLCFVMIETAEALENLEAIAAVPGIDGLFVGPVDLALSLGLGPAMVMPERVLSAIDDVVAVCRRYQLIAGCASLGLPNARVLMQRGVRFLPISSDAGLLRRGNAELAQAKEWPVD